MKIKDLTGKKLNRLLVLRMSLKRDNYRNIYWKCLCDCGNIKIINGKNLRSDHTKSCGCLNMEISTKHGFKNTKLYNIWSHIKQRCNDKNTLYYKHYGGRGIKYDPKWEQFINFKKDMYFKYIYAKKKYGEFCLSIEREDVNGNYCFNNCIFIPLFDQAKNRRKKVV
jgi:hypothetical protein